MFNKLFSIIIIFTVIWIWYYILSSNDIKQEDKQNNNENNQIELNNISKEEEIYLEKQEPELKKELTNKEKIEELKKNKVNYITFSLKNNNKAYFKDLSNSLDLYLNDKKISTFHNKFDKEELNVKLIEWSISDLYIEAWDKKYYYNSILWKTISINLNINILYAKKTNENTIIYVTDKGSFYYSLSNNKLEYFYYFYDYIIYKDWYIWLVKKEEERILKNLWIETDKNIILYYNPNSKEKSIFLETDLDIKKLYNYWNNVFLETIKWETFKIENIN